MEGVFMLIFLSITMLIGSFISGIIPLTLSLSESKMKHITILGAGLLIGTALAVIIPEGIHTLYSNANNKVVAKDHVHRRSIVKRSLQSDPLPSVESGDQFLIELFHNQISAGNRTNKLVKRFVLNTEDEQKLQLFLNRLSANMNVNRVLRSNGKDDEEINLFISRLGANNNKSRLIKRLTMTREDTDKLETFLNQLSAHMRMSKVLDKRDVEDVFINDRDEVNLFLSQLSAHNTTTRLIKRMTLTNEDRKKLDIFISQLTAHMNQPKVLRSFESFSSMIKNEKDKYLVELFINRISASNQITRLVKRAELNQEDYEKLEMFLNRLSANMNVNKVIDKRVPTIATQEDNFQIRLVRNQIESKKFELNKSDNDKLELFINRLSAYNRNNKVLRNVETDSFLMELFLNRLSAGNSNTKLIKRVVLTKDDYEKINLFLNQISAQMRMPKVLETQNRAKRAVIESNDNKKLSDDALKPNNDHISKENTKIGEADHDEHSHHHDESSGPAHSSIGVTLVLGFVFMLIVDQIGGKISHRPHQGLDTQAIRNKITFTTTLGLVVHSAADGIALGAAAATSRTDVEMIVFIAIMLHKAPAAFGLVSFLIHEGLERARVRKHLIIFAMAAPIAAIMTFIVLKSHNSMSLVTSDSTGLCMLFSAGTFLYVSTVHVLPEVQSHNEDRGFQFSETLSFIAGSMIPLILSVGHSH